MHPLRQAPASSNVQCECVIVQLAQKRQYPAIFFLPIMSLKMNCCDVSHSL